MFVRRPVCAMTQNASTKSAHIGACLVLPVRIELTTSPLPRARLSARIYFTCRNLFGCVCSAGADLVLHGARPAAIDGARCETLTWA
jgi:hypothetical protein